MVAGARSPARAELKLVMAAVAFLGRQLVA